MTHVRTIIRNAAIAALTGLVTSGSRVYPSRLLPLRDTDLPCLLITTNDEEIDGADVHAVLFERQLTLSVRCAAKVSGVLDDTLDTMIAEVETAISAHVFVQAKSVSLKSIRIDMDDSMDKPVGIAELSYVVTYYTAAGSPETAL